tara:strand:+ start:7103 stop:7585 length:483 start_codon:yes stop_codon:yes gene_type:complete
VSVVIRKVKTTLQREYRKAGGIPIEEAVDQAHENLGTLTEQCLARIDAGIGLVIEVTKEPARRPSEAELRQLHGLVNEMLACCAAAEIPGFVDTLYAVARLVAALMACDTWLEGALTPAVNLLRLARGGMVPPDDLRALIVGIDQCATRIRAHADYAPYH